MFDETYETFPRLAVLSAPAHWASLDTTIIFHFMFINSDDDEDETRDLLHVF